mmetsp:Transcript_29920/g.75358  ORF Transcript_29920/g.75358 Transcript_29920/m.75358 type:complete len:127 (+) Transcript_29920:140-520(+)
MAAQVAFSKVAEIRPDHGQVNAIVKVVSCEVKLQCLGQQPKRLTEVVVGDETGTILLRAEHAHAKLCAIGSTIVVRGARVELFDGRVRLELGRWSRVTRVGDAAFQVPLGAVAGDASATEFVVAAA